MSDRPAVLTPPPVAGDPAAGAAARALVDRVIGFLEGEARHEAAAGIVEQRDAPRKARPLVVVAGEDKRGKSSLVNALLGRPDLSPVGAKVVTGSPITFYYSATPEAEVLRYGGGPPEPVEVARAQVLATVDGNPGNIENISAVRIGLDIPLLQAVDLTDTPGVGGLESGHAALTLQSLQMADALLFAVEAGAPLRASELAFLRKAALRLQAVVLVLTKTDVYPHWAQIRDDDAAVLRDQAPRFANAPIIPVSAGSALRAVNAGDPEFAEEIRAESGIAALEEMLRSEVAAAVETVRLQNLLRSAIMSLAVLERDLSEQIAAANPDGPGLESLREERTRLDQLRQEKGEWPGRLDTELRKLTVMRSDTCARRVMQLRNAYDERSKSAKEGDFESLPGELLASLTALASELNELAVTRLAEMLSQVLDDLEQGGLRDEIQSLGGASLADQLMPFAAGKQNMEHGERMELLSELGRGRSLLSLATGSSALGFLAPPFGILIGLGLGGVFAFVAYRENRKHGRQAQFRTWMNEQISNAQLTINNGFALRITDLQNEMRKVVRTALGQREAQLNQSIEATTKLLQEEASQRRDAIAKLQAREQAAQRLRNEAVRLLATLSPAASGPGRAP